ncbi:hypothetical protein LTR10_005889 [Elasticomyces elasticus]|nr:hypothetical protein LTR10_005889 [Elasticomyces elasticus]KAK4965094.1 hypothetical protein LTR42_012513 [Elasticomyces elasticus]
MRLAAIFDRHLDAIQRDFEINRVTHADQTMTNPGGVDIHTMMKDVQSMKSTWIANLLLREAVFCHGAESEAVLRVNSFFKTRVVYNPLHPDAIK